jgi:hypothetical protein
MPGDFFWKVDLDKLEIFLVFFRILMDAPLGNQVVFDGCRPDGGIWFVPLLPGGIPNQDDKISPGFDPSECIPVLGTQLEKINPTPCHVFFSLDDIPGPVNKPMVFRH